MQKSERQVGGMSHIKQTRRCEIDHEKAEINNSLEQKHKKILFHHLFDTYKL